MVELTHSFEIEVEMIDSDYRHLVDLITEITKAIDANRPEECERLAPEFVSFAKAHFARGEVMFVKNSYPKVGKHRQHHTSLNDRMKAALTLAARVIESPAAQATLRKNCLRAIPDN